MSRTAPPDRPSSMIRSASLLVLLLLAGCARSAEAPPGTGGESSPTETKKEKSAPAAPPPVAAEPAPAPAAEGRALDAPKSTRDDRAEPATLVEAEAELALAERELDTALAPGAGAEQKGAGAAASPCERTCRAFASLSRAAAAVCRLEQPNAERCARANDSVGRARPRVASCACST